MNRLLNFFKALFDSSKWTARSLKSQQALQTEIHELKKTGLELQQRNKEYELLLRGLKNHAFFTLDTQGRVISWNSGAEKLNGYTAAEIIGQPLDVFYTPEQLQQNEPMQNLQRALSEGKYEVEGWRVRKDGSLFWADIIYTALFDDHQQCYGYTKVVRDISEKRKAEDHLLFLASIASNIQDPIISSDNMGNITRWNKAAELLLEWTADEVIGKAGTEILKIDYLGTTRAAILNSLEQKHYWHGEVIYHTKSGRPVNVLVTASQLKDSENNVIGNLGLIRDITERKQTEEKIKQSERLYSTLFYQSPGMKAISEASTGKYLDVNDAFARLLERSPGEVVDKTSLELGMIIQPEERERYLKQVQQFGFVRDIEMSILSASGKKYWVNISADLITLDGKKCFISDAVDITKRKEAEEALNRLNEELEAKVKERTAEIIKNEKRFRALIENNHDIISLCDDDFKVIYLSPSNTRITGWTEEELKSTDGTKRVHLNDMEQINTATFNALKYPGKPQPYLFRYLHKNGHYIWLEGNVTKLLHTDGAEGLVFNSRDVTQRVELETLLNKANALARIGSWEMDLIKNTIYWTDITREIHETEHDYTPDLTSGINFYKEGYDRDLITLKVREAIEFGTPWDVELKIVTAKTNERWIRSIGHTEFINGKCVRIYGSFQDIDQRKTAEEKIKNINIELEEKVIKRTEALQAANKELESFSYSVSHDLRAPLRSIIGFTSVLEEDYGDNLDAEAKRLIKIVKSSAAKMGDLIDDLLSFSRLGRQEIVKTNLEMYKMVNEIISEIGIQNAGANISWKVQALPDAMGSSATIRQVWTNLVYNAVKYSRKQQQPIIEIGTVPAPNETIYFVRDNGVGFNEAYSNKLFKVFQRLHRAEEFEGTGIGLAIVNRVISKHGGRVWATGTLGKGACFFFSLPIEKIN